MLNLRIATYLAIALFFIRKAMRKARKPVKKPAKESTNQKSIVDAIKKCQNYDIMPSSKSLQDAVAKLFADRMANDIFDVVDRAVLKQIISGRITYNFMRNSAFIINNLFSEYIDSKIDTFADNFRVKTDELYAIVKYRTDRSYTSGEEKENSD